MVNMPRLTTVGAAPGAGEQTPRPTFCSERGLVHFLHNMDGCDANSYFIIEKDWMLV